MNEATLVHKAKELISRDLELGNTEDDKLTEERLLQLITDRVDWLIEHNLELLLSSLYRLDVSEQKINQALLPTNDLAPAQAIAKLILDRQKQRIRTRLTYQQPDIEGWERF